MLSANILPHLHMRDTPSESLMPFFVEIWILRNGQRLILWMREFFRSECRLTPSINAAWQSCRGSEGQCDPPAAFIMLSAWQKRQHACARVRAFCARLSLLLPPSPSGDTLQPRAIPAVCRRTCFSGLFRTLRISSNDKSPELTRSSSSGSSSPSDCMDQRPCSPTDEHSKQKQRNKHPFNLWSKLVEEDFGSGFAGFQVEVDFATWVNNHHGELRRGRGGDRGLDRAAGDGLPPHGQRVLLSSRGGLPAQGLPVMPLALPALALAARRALARGPTSRTARVDAQGAPVGRASIAAVARMAADPADSGTRRVGSGARSACSPQTERAHFWRIFGEPLWAAAPVASIRG